MTVDQPPHPSATSPGPAEIVTENIGITNARITRRITGAEHAGPLGDDQLARVGRVILAVAATSYIHSEVVHAAGARHDRSSRRAHQ